MTMKLIFLADDDHDDVEFFQEALFDSCKPCTLVSSKNGLELLQKLEAAPALPDVIFLDINMPVMNGLDCLAAIRSKEQYNGIPVIVLTTSASSNTIERAYQRGANLFVEKPSDFSLLKKILRTIITESEPSHAVPMSSFVYRY